MNWTDQDQNDKWSNKPMYQGKNVVIEGDVRFGRDTSVWHNAVVRTESEPITIGHATNIQDGCILHTDANYPIHIGQHVTIGHGAIIHGATIEDDCLIGMGAIVLNGAHLQKGCLVGAGTLIPEHKTIEAGSLVVGVPGKVIRKLSPQDIEQQRQNAFHYVCEAKKKQL
ncbi:gamma carbonic anhydrase family protein [Allobaculum stercoricanis]|uniref:gamma carbonic anhydrase family protein n=1 Tax=Allobaculum stercoricanis TaxID=174709 RepID=UPI0029435289|nr:gamma carbonic anhydrase family protein [Allobaculum stercoricanis]